MEFKTVVGLGRQDVVRRAFNVAMDKGLSPEFVTRWEEWARGAKEGSTLEPGAVYDDCPIPEYHAGDLEEVATVQTQRIEAALRGLYTRLGAEMPDVISMLFRELEGELKTPGYVVGLVPQ